MLEKFLPESTAFTTQKKKSTHLGWDYPIMFGLGIQSTLVDTNSLSDVKIVFLASDQIHQKLL